MNFVKASNSSYNNTQSVNWNTNPIYQTPEQSGISWYDQVSHWDPSSEGIFSISQSSTNDPIPYWANRDADLSNLRSDWTRSQNQVAENAASIAPQASSSASFSTVPSPTLAAAEASLPDSVANAKSLAKVGNVVAGVGNTAASVASLTGPVGIAAAINAAAGAATAGAINAGNQNIISNDFVANSKQQGSQSTHQANLIRELDTAHAQVTNAGASIGGLAGPLGAWLGSLITNAIQDTGPNDNHYSDLKTGYSFEGRFNPQDTGAVGSASTANLSGESNLISNV
nr:MAG: hypothetical protein [Polycipiviridae sp.]